MYVTQSVSHHDDTAQPQTYEYVIQNLAKFTKYAVHVQPYNVKGAGPRSPDSGVLTLEDGE